MSQKMLLKFNWENKIEEMEITNENIICQESGILESGSRYSGWTLDRVVELEMTIRVKSARETSRAKE